MICKIFVLLDLPGVFCLVLEYNQRYFYFFASLLAWFLKNSLVTILFWVYISIYLSIYLYFHPVHFPPFFLFKPFIFWCLSPSLSLSLPTPQHSLFKIKVISDVGIKIKSLIELHFPSNQFPKLRAPVPFVFPIPQ